MNRWSTWKKICPSLVRRCLWLIVPCALLSSLVLPAWGEDAEALRLLQGFWARQKTTLTGRLGNESDPGFVFVVPPDSSLWAPGSLVLLTQDKGLTPAGSSNAVFPRYAVRAFGDSRSDIAIIETLRFGQGGLDFANLPGILGGLGLLHTQSTTTQEELELLLERQGIHRLVIAFPDVQIHRIGRLDAELALSRVPETVRRLLVEPGLHIVSAAVLARTIQLRFDIARPDPTFQAALETLLGANLIWKAGIAEWRSPGLYLAVQTVRCTDFHTQKGRGALTDSTSEAQKMVERVLSVNTH